MQHEEPGPEGRTRPRALIALALLCLLVAGVGGSVFAMFTATTDASQADSSGTVSLSGIGTNGPGNRLTIGASNIAPGDTIQRAVTLTNTGSLDLSAVRLTTVATTSSLLNTNATNGLRMRIQSCSVPWTESTSMPYTYACSGTTRNVLGNVRVTGNNRLLNNMVLTAGATNHLRVTLTLPTTAGNTFQNQTSVISYRFTATQRTGRAQ